MNNINEILSGSVHFGNIRSRMNGHFTLVYNSFLIDENFTGYEKLVLIMLKKYKMTHDTCWPSQKTLALKCGWSVSTIKKAIAGLERKGMIIKEKNLRRRSNTYRILDLSHRGLIKP